MRIYFFHELEKEGFSIFTRRVQFKLAYQSTENFMIVSSSGPYSSDDSQKSIEGKKGDYIVKGKNAYFVIPEMHFEKAFETFFIKEDFENVLSFYKRRINKDD